MDVEQRQDTKPEPVSVAREQMRVWRRAHPRATFAELEAVAEQLVAGVRAALLEEATAPESRERTDQGRPTCSACGQTLELRGEHKREVLIRGGESVRLVRSYAVCPACGARLFPPG